MGNMLQNVWKALPKASLSKEVVAALFGVGLLGAAAVYYVRYHGTIRESLLARSELKGRIEERYKNSKDLVKLDIVRQETIIDEGITFYFLIGRNFEAKPLAHQIKVKRNPFLAPITEDVFIGHLSSTHSLLLNKFSVVPSHVLVVTRAVEPQFTLLNTTDFTATFAVIEAIDGFAFFNCGELSGASVPHKHVQVIPKSEFSNSKLLDLYDKLAMTVNEGETIQVPQYQFLHVLVHLPDDIKKVVKVYKKMLKQLGNDPLEKSCNVLFTKRWMFIVVRKQEKACDGELGINSLGFVGSFLVKNDDLFKKVTSPLRLLEEISEPRPL
eukprot:TRINITY_DN7367_c0_g2_i1.p1 TRINITY_DN7367_c0_g2~~TRINITY_DN7367_c0_g2_i1.p1  ORF type:complete len:326 (-),score=78.34 TRINITY_DN7367_c0_g2_i1:212-1189(-)